jgi:amidohydrolase
MLLAAAKHLARHRNFDGTVYLVFQPAEEGGGGAREMIADGLFEKFPMEAIFGVHNWPGLPAGHFAIKNGPCFASSNEFRITLRGKGAHAAMPNLGLDPVPVACQMVQAFQTIVTRNKKPIDTAVISVTMIHTGEAINVVPDSAEIRGTVRTFSLEVLELIERRMREVAEHTAALRWAFRLDAALRDGHFRLYCQSITGVQGIEHGGRHLEILLRMVDPDTGERVSGFATPQGTYVLGDGKTPAPAKWS